MAMRYPASASFLFNTSLIDPTKECER